MTSVGRHRQQPDVVHRRRRRNARRVAAGTVLTLGAATLLVSGDWSQAAGAEQVLQAVQVSVGPDGSLTAVHGTDVAKQPGGVKTTSTDFAPKDVASKLPIAVSVSYLKDGVPGTDLSALKGAKGLVEVDVTVTNTTVSAQPVTYTSGGQTITQQSLVGTPLTVTGSVTLPKGSLAHVVMPTTATPGAHTTNGAVTSTDGGTTVSWAALLAPPQLSPTTTFTLVEQADKFQLPQLSIAAQPGYVTDPSIASLITRTFSSDSSAVATQNQAIDLVTQINGQLSAVSQTLGTIRENLDGTATDLANTADGQLDDATARIEQAASDLTGQLGDLQTTVGSAVDQSRSSTQGTLTGAIQSVQTLLGVPAPGAPAQTSLLAGALRANALPRATTPTAPSTGTCDTAPQTTAPAKVWDQLELVRSLASQLAGNAGACIQATRTALHSALGPDLTQDPTYCSTAAHASALVCSLQSTENDVDTALAKASGSLKDVEDAIGTGVAGDLGNTTTALAALAKQVTTTAQSLDASGDPRKADPFATGNATADGLVALRGNITRLVDTLEQVRQNVEGFSAGLQGVTGLQAISTEAATDSALIGSGGNNPSAPGTVLSAVHAAQTVACLATTSGNPVDGAAADLASTILVGTLCDGTKSDPVTELGKILAAGISLPNLDSVIKGLTGSVQDGLLADIQHWTSVAGEVDALNTLVTQEVGTIDALLNGDKGHGQLGLAGVQSILATLLGSYDPATDGSTLPTTLGGDAAAFETALGSLRSAIAGLDGNGTDTCSGSTVAAVSACLASVETNIAKTVGAGLTDGPDSVAAILQAAQHGTSGSGGSDAAIQAGIAGLGKAGGTADSDLGSLVAQLQAQLVGTTNAVVTSGEQQLQAATAALGTTSSTAVQQLQGSTSTALGQLGTAVQGATGDVSATSAQLQAQIAAAKQDIGGSTGGGILGTVQDSVGQAAGGSTRVDSAASQASGFKGVRIAEVQEALLEAAQASLASHLADQFPHFGGALPQGSTWNTVFLFQLAPVG